MIIDCISDLHGEYPDLEGGDLLIVAGDLTATDEFLQYEAFFKWLLMQKYKRKILIAGNHDGMLMGLYKIEGEETDLSYLCDSGTEFEGLKIYGSPWTPSFCDWHFMKDRGADIKEKWDLIPNDIDILVTHGPPHGILDECCDYDSGKIKNAGCEELEKAVDRIRPELVIFGHIHENGGQACEKEGILYINASLCNERYQPINRIRRVLFEEKVQQVSGVVPSKRFFLQE